MIAHDPNPLLRVVVVTGLPCSGKSKLAARLQEQCHVPLLSKDVYKERLFDSLGTGDRAWSRRLSNAAYDLMFDQAAALLACRIPCILEGNFRPADHTQRLAALGSAHGAAFVQVHCHARADVLVDRFRKRAHSGLRHPGHVDVESLPEMAAEISRTEQLPLKIGGLLVTCDTTDDWESAIERAAREAAQ